jgi:hypothetical protein
MGMVSFGFVVKLTKTGCVDYCTTFSSQLACLVQTMNPAPYKLDTPTLQFGLQPREVNLRVNRNRFVLHTAFCVDWKRVVIWKDTELRQVRSAIRDTGQPTLRGVPRHQDDTFSTSSSPKYIRDGSL